MAQVSGLWISPGRGSGRVDPVGEVRALADHGFEGCAHARPGGRDQVLLVSAEHLRAVGVDPGLVRENVTVEGADVQEWAVGSRFGIGDAVFEITLECEPCFKMDQIRAGLQEELTGRRGMLARVVEPGTVRLGDEIRSL
jgi:MOSC domain-containing protein YiiM